MVCPPKWKLEWVRSDGSYDFIMYRTLAEALQGQGTLYYIYRQGGLYNPANIDIDMSQGDITLSKNGKIHKRWSIHDE